MKIKKELMPFKALALKEKYNVDENKVVVVEKNTAVLKVIVVIVKIIVYTVLLSLALVGLIAIIIPETRNNLLMQANSVIQEFFTLISGG